MRRYEKDQYLVQAHWHLTLDKARWWPSPIQADSPIEHSAGDSELETLPSRVREIPVILLNSECSSVWIIA